MPKDKIIQTLRSHEATLRERFGVKSLALFGSAARGEATEASDVDVLVEFDRPISLFDLGGLTSYLKDVLGVEKVDVSVADSVHPALRENIFGEALHVFGAKMEIPH